MAKLCLLTAERKDDREGNANNDRKGPQGRGEADV